MTDSPVSHSPIGTSTTPTEIKNSSTPTSVTPTETKKSPAPASTTPPEAKNTLSPIESKLLTESPEFDKSPIPPTSDVEKLSEQTPEIYQVTAGMDTEELSDISEIEGTLSKSQSIRFSTIFLRISPFIRNKKVRIMLVINFIATIINMLLSLALIMFIIWNIVLYIHVRNAAGVLKFPCLFTYLEWSDCSATCRIVGEDYPRRIRKVNKSSIIQARGGATPECPANLADQIDSAPCNTYYCPTKLSEYNFTDTCYYNDANLRRDGGCYRIRNVPLDDRLILIDTYLTEECKCSNIHTPHV